MEMIVFTSRLREDMTPEELATYQKHLGKMVELAVAAPGYISHKAYTAEDGERLTLVLFDSAENLTAWRENTAHQAAQRAGRDGYYAWYRLLVGTVARESAWEREA